MFLFPKKIKNPLVTYVNLTEVISLKRGFHVSPYVAARSTEEEKCYETLHTFKFSLAPLNLVKHVSRSDF